MLLMGYLLCKVGKKGGECYDMILSGEKQNLMTYIAMYTVWETKKDRKKLKDGAPGWHSG